MARFEWRPKVAQFWNRTVGRLVPRLQVRTWGDMVLAESPVRDWAREVAAGDISVEEWHQRMRDEIKKAVGEQYLAGRGGSGQLTPVDTGSIGGVIGEQYKYLDKFAQEIAEGKLSEGQIARRSEMYINSAREGYERAQERAAKEAGMNRVRWVLGEAEHCEDCVDLDALGWQDAQPWPFKVRGRNAYPGSGATACLTNCRCGLHWGR